MYYPNQVVWNLDKQEPVQIDDDVWDIKSSYPDGVGKTTHFVDANGEPVCPKSIEEAKLLLQRRLIAPSLIHPNYCWSCEGEIYQDPRIDCKARDNHIMCDDCGIRYAGWGKKLGKMRCDTCYEQLEKDGMLKVAMELVKELELRKNPFDQHGSKASELINQLVELDDPHYIKRDGRFRNELDDIVRTRSYRKECARAKK